MLVKHDYYYSKKRTRQHSPDMVRLTIDISRIEGMQLKKFLEGKEVPDIIKKEKV